MSALPSSQSTGYSLGFSRISPLSIFGWRRLRAPFVVKYVAQCPLFSLGGRTSLFSLHAHVPFIYPDQATLRERRVERRISRRQSIRFATHQSTGLLAALSCALDRQFAEP